MWEPAKAFSIGISMSNNIFYGTIHFDLSKFHLFSITENISRQLLPYSDRVDMKTAIPRLISHEFCCNSVHLLQLMSFHRSSDNVSYCLSKLKTELKLMIQIARKPRLLHTRVGVKPERSVRSCSFYYFNVNPKLSQRLGRSRTVKSSIIADNIEVRKLNLFPTREHVPQKHRVSQPFYFHSSTLRGLCLLRVLFNVRYSQEAWSCYNDT